jgi:hypothetical protein
MQKQCHWLGESEAQIHQNLSNDCDSQQWMLYLNLDPWLTRFAPLQCNAGVSRQRHVGQTAEFGPDGGISIVDSWLMDATVLCGVLDQFRIL